MKLNITVELDWIDNDGDIDAEVKREIINGVKAAISRDCLARVEGEASSQINEAITESITHAQQAINQRAVQFVEDWLVKDVTITDKWGDIKEQISVKDMIKRSFDATLEKKVDSNGNITESHYGGLTLIKFLTGSYVQELVQEKISPLKAEIDSAIISAVNAGIRKNVSDKFAQMVVMTAKQQEHHEITSELINR